MQGYLKLSIVNLLTQRNLKPVIPNRHMQETLKLSSRVSFLPGIVWLVISTILFCLPGAAFPQGKWFHQAGLDKCIHVGLFAILVTLWCWAFWMKKNDPEEMKTWYTRVALSAFIYGVAIEIIQKYFIPNRSFDIGDVVADGIGVILGYFFSKRWILKKKPL